MVSSSEPWFPSFLSLGFSPFLLWATNKRGQGFESHGRSLNLAMVTVEILFSQQTEKPIEAARSRSRSRSRSQITAGKLRILA
jgi:hypothetical protein